LPSDARLQTLLRSGADEDHKTLINYGERLFPAYERLLADKTKNIREVEGILGILRYVKADRSRFVDDAAEVLASPLSSWRRISLQLLADIGRERDASPVVALLSDEQYSVAYNAAETLAAIGGPRELVAFDIWLITNPRRKDEELRRHVAKCRAELKQRLEKVKKPGK
jgi:HEAT repeat protein